MLRNAKVTKALSWTMGLAAACDGKSHGSDFCKGECDLEAAGAYPGTRGQLFTGPTSTERYLQMIAS